MNASRLEAFSDGVFAIAATLLVLELKVPHVAGTDLAAAVLGQWPAYIAYLVSFLTIGIIWVNHHALFAHVKRVDRTLLFLNLALLMAASAIPFPTALVGEYALDPEAAPIAAAVYGVVAVLMSIAFSAVWLHVTRGTRLLGGNLDPRRARREGALFSIGLLAYGAGVGLAFIAPTASLVLYGLIAVFYIFPWLPPAQAVEPGAAALA
jgi:uncharacterized membrane protein